MDRYGSQRPCSAMSRKKTGWRGSSSRLVHRSNCMPSAHRLQLHQLWIPSRMWPSPQRSLSDPRCVNNTGFFPCVRSSCVRVCAAPVLLCRPVVVARPCLVARLEGVSDHSFESCFCTASVPIWPGSGRLWPETGRVWQVSGSQSKPIEWRQKTANPLW
jgi:hypothetical protein